jgi:hypothetical protein
VQITPEQHNKLDEHLSGPSGTWYHQPPWAVYAAMATLIDPDDIAACYCAATSIEDNTCWSVWIVTSIALARFEVEFEAANYGAASESDRLDRSPPEVAGAKISKACVDRSVADAVKVEFAPHSDYQKIALTDDLEGATAHHHPGRKKPNWLPTPGIRITFADDRTVELPGQPEDSYNRERWEKFTNKVRELIPVLAGSPRLGEG